MALRLARIFCDHMVLQRNKPCAIFGYAPDGAEVSARLAHLTARTVAQEGKFLFHLPAAEIPGAHTLTVSCKGEEISVRDVVYGEVWMASGQSNMEFKLADSLGGMEEACAANQPLLRYYHTPKVAFEEERDARTAEIPETWVVCTPETAGDMSGVAYWFAQRVMEAENVPVGIVGCNWGGTSAACWMSREALDEFPKLSVYTREYEVALAAFTCEQHRANDAAYQQSIADYNRRMAEVTAPKDDIRAFLEATKDITFPWPPPMNERCYLRPHGLFGAMVAQLAPYTLGGVLWYQGESDVPHAPLYSTLLGAMMRQWREVFLSPELPFALVQLTMYGADGSPDGIDWALLREQQQKLADADGHACYAVITDVGEEMNIHPVDKRTVGLRLARQVLRSVYGHNVDARHVKVVSTQTEDGKMILSFDGELHADGEATGFALSGEDGVFHPAKAGLRGNTAELVSDAVPQPVHARYMFANYLPGNVYQANGDPLGQFRTD